MTSSHPWLGWSHPSLPPTISFLFSVSDAVAQSQTSVVSCQVVSAKISRSGCWESFWPNEESRRRCCRMCKHHRYVCGSGFKAADGRTEERWLGRGHRWAEEQVRKLRRRLSSVVSFPQLGNSNSGCSCENVGATWTPKRRCFAIYRSGLLTTRWQLFCLIEWWRRTKGTIWWMYKTWRWSKIVTINPKCTFLHHVSASHGSTLWHNELLFRLKGLSHECCQSDLLKLLYSSLLCNFMFLSVQFF